MLTRITHDIERRCADYTFSLGIICMQATHFMPHSKRLNTFCTCYPPGRIDPLLNEFVTVVGMVFPSSKRRGVALANT